MTNAETLAEDANRVSRSPVDRRIAVVIPSFRVSRHVLEVIAAIPPEVWRIYVVDDACPEHTGTLVRERCTDPRVVVLMNERNLGVGGATLRGFVAARADGAAVLVKIDGDGQMQPSLIPRFVRPIVYQRADYTKGNRFFDLESTREMPKLRLFGNAVLSFMIKLSSGYWNIFDPTNGFIAMDARLLQLLPVAKIKPRYFFESDLLFRLGTLRAVVLDIPMQSRYGDESSNLRIGKILLPFFWGHLGNTWKRIFYSYFLRDFSVSSINLLVGLLLMAGGTCLGAYKWLSLAGTGQVATSGTVMLAALPIILGFQLLLSVLNFDIQNVPRDPIGKYLDMDS